MRSFPAGSGLLWHAPRIRNVTPRAAAIMSFTFIRRSGGAALVFLQLHGNLRGWSSSSSRDHHVFQGVDPAAGLFDFIRQHVAGLLNLGQAAPVFGSSSARAAMAPSSCALVSAKPYACMVSSQASFRRTRNGGHIHAQNVLRCPVSSSASPRRIQHRFLQRLRGP